MFIICIMILFQIILLFLLFRSKEVCPCHRDEKNYLRFSFMKSRDMLTTSTDEKVILVATNFVQVIIFTIQNKFVYRVLIFICRRKYFHDEDNNITVTRYLLRDGMSMEKVTKAFSYSFNVFHVLHSSAEGGTGKISEIELVELNTLNESTFCVNFYCVKSTFSFGKIIFDKAMKLVEGVIKPLQRQKTLKVLTKV